MRSARGSFHINRKIVMIRTRWSLSNDENHENPCDYDYRA
jgi:hypothetical protein